MSERERKGSYEETKSHAERDEKSALLFSFANLQFNSSERESNHATACLCDEDEDADDDDDDERGGDTGLLTKTGGFHN